MKTRIILLGLALVAMAGTIFIAVKPAHPTPADTAANASSETGSDATTKPNRSPQETLQSPTSDAHGKEAALAQQTTGRKSGAASSSGFTAAAPGLRAGSSSAVPAPVGPGEKLPALVPGLRASARMNVRGQSVDLEPNQVGSFPRVNLDPGQQVSVVVQWPDAQAGQRVVVAVEDGGELNDGQRVLPLDLDGAGSASFEFTAGRGPGIYRVTLRHKQDVKTLEMWVGPELALQE